MEMFRIRHLRFYSRPASHNTFSIDGSFKPYVACTTISVYVILSKNEAPSLERRLQRYNDFTTWQNVFLKKCKKIIIPIIYILGASFHNYGCDYCHERAQITENAVGSIE